MSSVAPTPEPASIPEPVDPAPAPAPAASKRPTKFSIALRALTVAITSKAAMKLEFALARYIVQELVPGKSIASDATRERLNLVPGPTSSRP